MADNRVIKAEGQEVGVPRTGEVEAAYVPAVDIFEDGERFRLLADMPGVDPKDVDVRVENNVLTIEGRARVEGPKGYTLAGQEHEASRFRRDFTLSEAVAADGIRARVVSGVLELTLPKRETVRTRKIEVEG